MTVLGKTDLIEYGLNDNFSRVNIEGTVINMTNGYSPLRKTEPPYFLLSTGELINEEGSKYEELEGNFVKTIGDRWDPIYIGEDNSISYYDDDTRQYIKIKDDNGEEIKIKAGFWDDYGCYVITQDYKLFRVGSLRLG